MYSNDLSKTNFSDIYYTIGSKKLLLKLYYHLDEEEAMYSLITSFKVYLQRNTFLSEEIKVSYINFTKILEKIIRGGSRSIIQNQINETDQLIDKKWLLSIIS